MARPNKGDRCNGPYAARGKWLLRFFVGDDVETSTYASEAEARKAKASFYKALEHESRIVSSALDAYESYLIGTKGNKKSSVATTVFRLRAFFAPVIFQPLTDVTHRRARRLYEEYREAPTRTGRPPAVATQRNTLKQARTFLTWCVRQSWLPRNGLTDVEGIGRPNVGKPRLRIDEARSLFSACLDEGSESSTAVLVTFVMGLRATECVSIRARDVDDAARVLWIDDAPDTEVSHLKTHHAHRALEVPDVLRPLLMARKEELRAGLLFPGRTRHWLLHHVRRLCQKAGVPPVCTHSLRGTHSTLAQQLGMTADVVAGALGHGSPEVTRRHYTEPGTQESAQQRRALTVIMGGVR